MSTAPIIKSINVDALHFDYKNPRLIEYDITSRTTEDEILVILWEAEDVQELVQSIAASSYFPTEALIVVEENDRYVVIEGNRRLAAVKVLRSPELAKAHEWDVPKISKAEREKLGELPCIIWTREGSWRSLGFKHINGPAKWSSFAKSAYIAEVHRNYGVPLDQIASQLGDGFKTVQRLYRGFVILEQAEKSKVYDREDRFNKKFAFSHLYTGVGLSGISTFLQISSDNIEDPKPVPKSKLKELGELCVWLYGSKKLKQPPLIKSQNPDLDYLSTALESKDGLAALRAGIDLEKAREISRPPGAVFEEALFAAKRELITARGYLTTGYNKSEELLRTAGTILDMAEDLYSAMERDYYPDKKKNRLTER
jgi:hypothetical protein